MCVLYAGSTILGIVIVVVVAVRLAYCVMGMNVCVVVGMYCIVKKKKKKKKKIIHNST